MGTRRARGGTRDTAATRPTNAPTDCEVARTLSTQPARREIKISVECPPHRSIRTRVCSSSQLALICGACASTRSEEHTSELQSHVNLVCRLLLEKKNTKS